MDKWKCTVFSLVRVTRSLVLCVCFVDYCLSVCTLSLAIVLSVLQYKDSDYPFGIFKLFLYKIEGAIKNGQSRNLQNSFY